jgi:ABC-type bacteriocin/lantibiotic exporter with double-glycine peptidase domain
MQRYALKSYTKIIIKYFDLKEEDTGTVIIKEFNSLETDNLKINYNGQVVEIPNIKITAGEKVLIRGESGIGKSSLFNIIMGLRKDYTGSIRVNSYNLAEINIESLRKIIGISFQGQNVFSFNLKENITLGNEEVLNFNKIIQITQLEKIVQDKQDSTLNAKTLSGGEQSRISIAQSLIRNPHVILIDESLSSVDEAMESEIIKNIIDNFKDKTIICISHRKSTQEHFDKVVQFLSTDKLVNN